jgi:hypothetical protein
VARKLVSLPINQEEGCPELGQTVSVDETDRQWEDVDCGGTLALGDAIALARHLVSLPVNAAVGCPQIGQSVQMES